MKTLATLLFAGAVATMAAMPAAADEGAHGKAEKPAKKELKAQTNCPVMGGEIDSAIYTDIQGQRVYHCCRMCSPKLKADPDKYFKKAAEEGILFENIQTNCPVTGKELKEKSVFVDYEGRRVYFCCKMCPDKFLKDPQSYLSKLDKPATEKKTAQPKEMPGHMGDQQGHQKSGDR